MIPVMRDPDLGKIYIPPSALATTVYAGGHARRPAAGEVGVIVAKQKRPVFDDDGVLRRMALIWADISHNERLDVGASKQAQQVFGGGAAPAAPSATAYFNVIALASATFTKTKTDLSVGSATTGVTTNEFTTIGLARAVATISAGNYTAPTALGGTFAQVISKLFTATGTGTVFGMALFDSATVAGSVIYLEDLFGTSAALVANDQLTASATVNN